MTNNSNLIGIASNRRSRGPWDHFSSLVTMILRLLHWTSLLFLYYLNQHYSSELLGFPLLNQTVGTRGTCGLRRTNLLTSLRSVVPPVSLRIPVRNPARSPAAEGARELLLWTDKASSDVVMRDIERSSSENGSSAVSSSYCRSVITRGM